MSRREPGNWSTVGLNNAGFHVSPTLGTGPNAANKHTANVCSDVILQLYEII